MAGQIHIDALEQAAQREIEAGLTACQLAVARDGEIVWSRSFGTADEETRFWVASATKPIVSSAILILIIGVVFGAEMVSGRLRQRLL